MSRVVGFSALIHLENVACDSDFQTVVKAKKRETLPIFWHRLYVGYAAKMKSAARFIEDLGEDSNLNGRIWA